MSTCLIGCENEAYFPKPHGHFRIGFPDTLEMKQYNGDCNYTFEYPQFAVVKDKPNCNQDIYFPNYNAVLYITSIQFDGTDKNNQKSTVSNC